MTDAASMTLPKPKTNKWLVTVSITFGTLMGAIDASIVNVALPHIRGSVSATMQEITWIATGYAIALVLVMPLTGFLGRLFGQKRVYLASLVMFLVGSAFCGLASSLTTLVFFRVLQGLGAGALQPTEQAILRQTFPPEEQGMAMALFGMAVMLGPAVGPTLGGYIVDHWHWSWIFFINLPIGALGLFMVTSFVHEDEEIRAKNQQLAEAQRKNVDWWGIGLMAVGLVSLEFFLEEGQKNDWFASRTLSVVFFLALVSLAAFVIRELTCELPAVNLRLFKDPVFASGTLVGGLMFSMLMSNMFLLPLFMQELMGFTATQSGLSLMPRIVVMMMVTPIIGRIYNRVWPQLVMGIGVVLVALGSLELSHLTLDSGQRDVIVPIMVQGAGFACLFVPLTTLALSRVPRHKMADATGLNSLVRQVGGAMGLAVFASLLSSHAAEARSGLVGSLAATRPEVVERLQGSAGGLVARGLDPSSARGAALGLLDGGVSRQAMVLSFEWVFMLAGLLFLLALPLLFFLRRGSPQTSAAASAEI